MTLYKPSMYNNIVIYSDNKLRLYNSYVGAKGSLIQVSEKKKEKILNCLNGKTELNEKVIKDNDIKILIDKGFLVKKEVDEKLLRELQYNDVKNESGLFLMILPTEQCNFRCKYCYESYQKSKMSLEIQNAIITFIKKNIRKYTDLSVAWFGGEPLLAIDVIDNISQNLIKICEIARKPYSANITSNGYCMTYEIFKKLIKNKIVTYQITLDGVKNQHDSLRVYKDGSPTYDKIINNLLDIKNNLSKRDICKIFIRTNFTQSILNDLDNYIDMYEKNFSNDTHFELLVQQAGDWGGNSVKEIYNNILPSNYCGVIMNKIHEKSNSIKFNKQCDFLEPNMAPCYASRKNAYIIGSDGCIYKCSADFENENNKIGRLTEDGNMIIDKSLESKWVMSKNRKDLTNCDNCSFSGCCLYGTCPKHQNCPKEKYSLNEIIISLEEELFFKI